MEFLMMLLDYYVSGGLKILETGMILVLLVFIGWNVKLFMEKPRDGETMEEPAED